MDDKAYASKSKTDIAYFVNARQKTYLSSTEIYIPNDPYEKIEQGYELSSPRNSSGAPVPTSEVEKLERSRRRSFTTVKDIALSNIFELFATFSFKDDRFDDEKSRDKMAGWLKRQRKHDKEFQYVIVSELHKKCEECVNTKQAKCPHDDRPKALHYHALIKGYKGALIPVINPRTGKHLKKDRRLVYDFPNFTLGYSQVYFIGDTEEDRIKSGSYLLKYLKKDMTIFKSKKRYWSSRGLNKPIVIENPQEWFFAVTPDHFIEMSHGKYLFFDNKRIEIFLP